MLGKASDGRHQLRPLVGHKPRIEQPVGLGARPTIDHHSAALVFDEQPRRRIAR
jgi:hypothetical protein